MGAPDVAAPFVKRRGPPGHVRKACGQKRPYGSVAPMVRAWLDKHGVGEGVEISRDLGFGNDTTSNGVVSALKAGVARGELAQPFRGVYALPDVAQAMLAAVDAANAMRRK